MKELKKRTGTGFTLFGLIYILFQFVDPLFPVEDSNRFFPIFLQLNLVAIGCYYLIKYFILYRYNKFGNTVILFILYIFIYAIFSEYFNNISLMLMSITAFFPSFIHARKNSINVSLVYKSLYVLVIYLIFLMLTNRDTINEAYNSNFEIADNYGYLASMISIVFLFDLKRKSNIIFFVISTLLTFYSMKKGAILCSLVISSFFVYDLVFSRKKYKISIRVMTIILIFVSIFIMNIFISNIVDRFNNIESSGRDFIYTTIYDAWENSESVSILFGHGYFATLNLMDGLYAHSDWFEILYDFGVFGIIIYTVLFVVYIRNYRKLIKYDSKYKLVFYSLLAIWLIKSMISGVIVGKDSFLIFFASGLMFGQLEYLKSEKLR